MGWFNRQLDNHRGQKSQPLKTLQDVEDDRFFKNIEALFFGTDIKAEMFNLGRESRTIKK